MNRRSFLRTLLSGVAGSVLSHELDIDRLLWISGQKTIFLSSEASWIHDPSGVAKKEITSLIVELELERIAKKIPQLFERDDAFYEMIKRSVPLVSSREIRIPLSTGETNVIDASTVGEYVGIDKAYRGSDEES